MCHFFAHFIFTNLQFKKNNFWFSILTVTNYPIRRLNHPALETEDRISFYYLLSFHDDLAHGPHPNPYPSFVEL